MAIAKTGYSTLNTATTSVKVNLNTDGNIAQAGDTIKGSKNISVRGVNIDNDLTSNTEVLGAFIGYFGGGTQDSLTNTMTAKWEAE